MKRISAVELAGALLKGFNVLGESWSSFGGCCEIPGHEDNGYYGNRDVKALLSSREPYCATAVSFTLPRPHALRVWEKNVHRMTRTQNHQKKHGRLLCRDGQNLTQVVEIVVRIAVLKTEAQL